MRANAADRKWEAAFVERQGGRAKFAQLPGRTALGTVSGEARFLTTLLRDRVQPFGAPRASWCANPPVSMKNDYSFKLVALIIIAGVIVAFAGPRKTAVAPGTPAVDAAPVAHATTE
jgi:hypothetical protein